MKKTVLASIIALLLSPIVVMAQTEAQQALILDAGPQKKIPHCVVLDNMEEYSDYVFLVRYLKAGTYGVFETNEFCSTFFDRYKIYAVLKANYDIEDLKLRGLGYFHSGRDKIFSEMIFISKPYTSAENPETKKQTIIRVEGISGEDMTLDETKIILFKDDVAIEEIDSEYEYVPGLKANEEVPAWFKNFWIGAGVLAVAVAIWSIISIVIWKKQRKAKKDNDDKKVVDIGTETKKEGIMENEAVNDKDKKIKKGLK